MVQEQNQSEAIKGHQRVPIIPGVIDIINPGSGGDLDLQHQWCKIMAVVFLSRFRGAVTKASTGYKT